MLLFRFVYCTHFPATYFEVGVPSGSTEVILILGDLCNCTNKQGKGPALLHTLLQIPDEHTIGCFHRVAAAQLSTAEATFCSPDPKTTSPHNALAEKQVPSATDVHTASHTGEERGPASAILLSDQFQCTRVTFYCWHPNGASTVRPCTVCAYAGSPQCRTCSLHSPAYQRSCSPLYRRASMKLLQRPLG